jgi:hypothetical protein
MEADGTQEVNDVGEVPALKPTAFTATAGVSPGVIPSEGRGPTSFAGAYTASAGAHAGVSHSGT